MKRYWFEFEKNQKHNDITLGCGVTAYNYDDAVYLLNSRLFKGVFPNPKKVIEDIDVSTLDIGHILPNMSPPNIRGIWYPLGYNLG